MSDPSRADLRHLAALTEEQRCVLELRVVHGLSAEQAALVLDSTVAAVLLLQHHALNALRDAITWHK
ncbi:sigma factor-like helix-turn-helix DNA-binding protein [Lentzea sp. NPDC059081]|uniref:sigma factor-like helix-turn-helix DNA-binding protein n=1 Tax=Lentzea sp. NPDC059081 TaxID=3346719 RepID=UPI0036BECCDC